MVCKNTHFPFNPAKKPQHIIFLKDKVAKLRKISVYIENSGNFAALFPFSRNYYAQDILTYLPLLLQP
jgi:hypothetical protein